MGVLAWAGRVGKAGVRHSRYARRQAHRHHGASDCQLRQKRAGAVAGARRRVRCHNHPESTHYAMTGMQGHAPRVLAAGVVQVIGPAAPSRSSRRHSGGTSSTGAIRSGTRLQTLRNGKSWSSASFLFFLSRSPSAAFAVGCPLLGEMTEGASDLGIGGNHRGQHVTGAALAGDLATFRQARTRGCEVAVERYRPPGGCSPSARSARPVRLGSGGRGAGPASGWRRSDRGAACGYGARDTARPRPSRHA